MSQNNIENNLFGAIDVIITEKMKGLQFDLTKVCSITDVSKARDGAYTVTDGSITFEAYSENNTYKVGDAVRVSVPNADFTDKKYIVGKYVTDNSITPITYVSPLESILDITNNLVPKNSRGPHYIYANEHVDKNATIDQLIDNAKGKLMVTIRPNIASLEISEIYDTFYIAAEFRTLLGDYDILTGNYGIRAEFHEGDQTHEVYLDCKDMFGDPYNFAVFTSQSQTYNIEKIKQVDEISLYFYQFNNFSYDNNGEPAVLPCDKTLPANLQLTNLTVGFGTMLSNMDDNTVKIYTNSSKEYNKSSVSSREKKVNLLWYNKNEFGKYLGFTDGEFYDEFADYIIPQAHKRALMKYLGDDQVPHDERGLTIADALNQLNIIIDDIVKYTDETILPEINNFKIQTKKTITDVDIQYTNISNSKKSITSIQEKASVYIKQTLAAAAWKYNPTSLTEDERTFREKEDETLGKYPALTEFNYVAEISTECGNIVTALDLMLDYIPETSYLGIYDNFKLEIEKLKAGVPINDDFEDIELVIKPDYVNEYQSNSNYEFKLYEGDAELEQLKNKYSIYWYRYDPNSLLDNTFISGDSFVSANWKRDTKVINEKYYTFIANANKNTEEHVMAVVFYNHEYYKSNVITFTNSDKVLDDRTENLTAGIVLSHGNDSKEAYQLYGSTNSLLNQAEAYYDREVVVQFMENDTTVNNSKLDNCQIYWYLPNTSTMLAPSAKHTQMIKFDKTGEEQSEYALEGYTCYYQPAAAENTNRNFYYRIKDYYVQSATQNHIKCKVVTPDEYSYDATIYFGFSSFGTSGTDYTLHITPVGEWSAVSPNENKPLELKVSLYDYNNELVENQEISVSLIPPNNYNIEKNDNIIKVFKNKETNNYYGIVEVSAKVSLDNGQLVDLKSYYPLAYATDNYFIEGATTIIYNDAGASPVYYKDPYKLYKWGTQEPLESAWKIKDETNNDNEDILPTINKDNILRPCVMYVDGVDMQPVAQCEGYYYQSIYIGQNRYQMSMLNAWDNSLTIDEKNGTILSQLVGAGRKNQDNQFSGVLMGEVDRVDTSLGNHSGYGLYGFHEGAQSFGFNVDGTAFLGKSGRGRIIMNGNSGTIESASYQSLKGTAGMKIDLDDGSIHMRGAERKDFTYNKNLQSEIYLGVIPENDAYFSVKSENGNELIHIGHESYYLQTDNFSNSEKILTNQNNEFLIDDEENYLSHGGLKAGTKIDLQSGKITSYNFTIEAEGTNGSIFLSSEEDNNPFKITGINKEEFHVGWDGSILATAGQIGKDEAGHGLLAINGVLTLLVPNVEDSGSTLLEKSINNQMYMQYNSGMIPEGEKGRFHLTKQNFGITYNDYFLGSPGFFMRPASDTYRKGFRLTSDRLAIEGSDNNEFRSNGETALTEYTGNGFLLYQKEKDVGNILFGDVERDKLSLIGSIYSSSDALNIKADTIKLQGTVKLTNYSADNFPIEGSYETIGRMKTVLNDFLTTDYPLTLDRITALETELVEARNTIKSQSETIKSQSETIKSQSEKIKSCQAGCEGADCCDAGMCLESKQGSSTPSE